MSWDIVIFSSKQKIDSIEEIDEESFEPTDFNAILEKHFDNVIIDGDHREIKGENYAINYFANAEPTGNMLFNLYGENSLFELIRASKKYGWQIFDTGNGQMIDLDHPEKNGYQDFQNYLRHVLKDTDDNQAT
jgi:hypothetical protein